MNRFFEVLARTVVRYRYLVIAVWVGVAVVSTVALPSMRGEVNNDNSQFLPASAPSQQAAVLAGPLLGGTATGSQVIVLAARPSGTLTAADQHTIGDVVIRLRRVPRVTAVTVAKVSASGSAAEILVDARVGPSAIPAQATLVDAVQATFPRAGPGGLRFYVAGPVAVNVANQKSSERTLSRVQDLSVLLIIVLLLVVFRAPLAALITLLPPGFALVIAMRFIGGLGASGVKISEITEILLVVLLLGAGTDYGLFLVFRVREAMAAGLPPREAVTRALVRVGESISASAGTVILALLTLLLASFGVYRDLGIPLAVGVAVMLVAGLTLLPALLAVFGRAAFWPRRTGDTRRVGMWGAIAGHVVRRPVVTLSVGVVIFLGLAAAALGYRSAGFGGALSAPAGSQAAAGNAILARDFPHSTANPANLVLRYRRPVWQTPRRLVEAQSVLQRSGLFRELAGPLDPDGTVLTPSQYTALHAALGPPTALPPLEPAGRSIPVTVYEAYRATALFVSPDGTTIQFEAALVAGDQQTTAAMNATPQVRRALAEAAARSGATASGVAGEAAALYDVSSASNSDLAHIIPVAIIAIALLLALVLRSLIAPVYLVISVALSYLAALGVATLVFIDIAGTSGLTFVLPFLMFVFLLALGEDYNILVMTRIREEARHMPLRRAVVEAVGRTGPTVTSAGIILAGSFAVIGFAGGGGPSGGQIRDIGFGLAVGILMDTFLVRSLLVPATVALLGRWNWWPSRVDVPDGHVAGGSETGGRWCAGIVDRSRLVDGSRFTGPTRRSS